MPQVSRRRQSNFGSETGCIELQDGKVGLKLVLAVDNQHLDLSNYNLSTYQEV